MTWIGDEQARRLLDLAAEPKVIGGRFELGTRLGEGGMGVVYEAWDREGQCLVALKLLQVDRAGPDGAGPNGAGPNGAARARFEREAQVLASLDHPAFVRYVAHGATAAGENFLAMERLSGLTLAERLVQGALRVQDALEVGYAVAVALAVAHGRGLVHRDIKPGNLFLENEDVKCVKILDFGLAHHDAAPALTRAGALVGTPSYMAPEQARGELGHEPRVDLFALGAVLFECLTGQAPFASVDTERALVKILVGQVPSVGQFCPAAPAGLSALVERLLSKEPSGRPATAHEVLRELDALRAAVTNDTAPLTAARPSLTAGVVLGGKYRVERPLGSGGMGVVLLAWHVVLEHHVAVKLLRSGDAEGEAVERLLREARAACRLESEHVARVMDVGTLTDGSPFVVMEFLRGKDLGQVLRECSRLPIPLAIDYLLQAADAIAEAHSLGIVHRDIKPSNLFLTTRRDGSPLIKVLDFGISKHIVANGVALTSLTAPDVVVGSPFYMAPEQLAEAKLVDGRTDIWSLGVVLQELVTGRRPFDADNALAIGAKIAAGQPADLRGACPEASDQLVSVVLRCLEKDPARRFASVGEFASALSACSPPSALPRKVRSDPSNESPAMWLWRVGRHQAAGLGARFGGLPLLGSKAAVLALASTLIALGLSGWAGRSAVPANGSVGRRDPNAGGIDSPVPPSLAVPGGPGPSPVDHLEPPSGVLISPVRDEGVSQTAASAPAQAAQAAPAPRASRRAATPTRALERDSGPSPHGLDPMHPALLER